MQSNSLRTVPNPARGCGHLKPGGFYARSDLSSSGRLATWSWTLGENVFGGLNLNITCPPRQMKLINLPMTLARRSASDADVAPVRFDPPLMRLPQLALLDHIGSEFYPTPWAFAQECKTHGPSRKVPQAIAAKIAGILPIPILFTHAQVPVTELRCLEPLVEWAGQNPADYHIVVTCYEPDWGITRDGDHGDYHWLVPVLGEVDRLAAGSHTKHLTEIIPYALAEDTLLVEQTIGISWLTRVVYILKDGNTDDELQAIAAQGIEPVIADRE